MVSGRVIKYYKFMLLKAYFEKGYSLTSYIKWVIAIFGITTQAVITTLIGMFLYGVSCFFIGWVWYKYDFVVAEHEVSNQFNLFQREMRKKLKNRNI